jgi:ubiquinol-cytochrome c reductase subunit 6
MGITDFFTDAWETFAHPSPDAEVQGGTSTNSPASGTNEESSEEAEINKQDEKKGGESQEQGYKPSSKPSDEEPEEEEEEEEEPDPKEKLEKGECDCAVLCWGTTNINGAEGSDEFDGPLGDLWRPLECRTYGAYIIWTCADDNITECAESKECHPAKHHYDECVERVTGQIENDGKASEDCVEECT